MQIAMTNDYILYSVHIHRLYSSVPIYYIPIISMVIYHKRIITAIIITSLLLVVGNKDRVVYRVVTQLNSFGHDFNDRTVCTVLVKL